MSEFQPHDPSLARHRRRTELMDRKYLGDGLTAAEDHELDRLHAEVRADVLAANPRTALDDDLLAEIERRLAAEIDEAGV